MNNGKKCPYCGEELNENAKFCFFCMRSLEEKTVIKVRRRNPKIIWYIFASVIISAAVIALVICLFSERIHNDPEYQIYSGIVFESSKTSSYSSSDTKKESTQAYPGIFSEKSGKTETERGYITNPHENPFITQQKNNNSPGHNQSEPTSPGNPQTTAEKIDRNTEKNSPPQTTAYTQNSEIAHTTKKETQTEKEPFQGTTWYYRQSYQSEYLTRYFDTKNGRITIVGFDKIPDNGIVVVPAEINGYVVVAINFDTSKYNSFNTPGIAEKIKKVYFPPNFESLSGKPFEKCINLSDVYFSYTDYIAVYVSSFAPVENRKCDLTIHCPSTTRNMENFYPFSTLDSQNRFNAKYEEWNGSEVYG